ncbi:MAG: hypothetical protein IJ242_06160 [Clostridia bacterium]|nr:hypothetical protein [Clostridia bacterium]
MSLFGRRKPGFSREVEMKPSEIPGEFSDALDPAINPPAEEKPDGQDVFEYMQSLPDVEDPFPSSEPEAAPPPEPEKTKAQLLADFIRERCKSALITPKALIAKDEEDVDGLLAAMAEDETCKDILKVEGHKDVYYYSEDLMAHNYAKIAMLTLEKDDARTVAEMVRFNCRAFPTPTPVYYFARQPFFLPKDRMDLILAQMKENDEYKDIRECTAEINGEKYLYSIDLMSEKYARALANGTESREADD